MAAGRALLAAGPGAAPSADLGWSSMSSSALRRAAAEATCSWAPPESEQSCGMLHSPSAQRVALPVWRVRDGGEGQDSHGGMVGVEAHVEQGESRGARVPGAGVQRLEPPWPAGAMRRETRCWARRLLGHAPLPESPLGDGLGAALADGAEAGGEQGAQDGGEGADSSGSAGTGARARGRTGPAPAPSARRGSAGPGWAPSVASPESPGTLEEAMRGTAAESPAQLQRVPSPPAG